MKLRLLIIAAALGFSILIPGACLGASGELATPDPAWLRQMLQDGWEKVQPGVLQRDTGGGRVETFTHGPEGLRWTVQRLQERISSLQREYNQYPSPELAGVIASLQEESMQVVSGFSSAQADELETGELVAAGCEPTFGVSAAADPLTGSQGVTARADASYSSPCGDPGNVYSYAYSRATAGTLTTVKIQEEPKTGTSLATTATVSVNGSLDCYSEAYARAWSPALGLSYETSDTNSTCPGPTTPTSTPSSPSGWTDEGSFVRLTTETDSVRLGPGPLRTKLDVSSGTRDFTNLFHLQTGIAGGGAYFGVGSTINNETYFNLAVYRGGVITNRFYVNQYGHISLQPSGEGNVVIGPLPSANPKAKLQVVDGDVYVSTVSRGVILKSPNGSCFRTVVSDAGALSTAAVACP